MSIPGSNIRLLREHMGMSLRSLAEASGADLSTLSRLERGIGGYSRETIEAVARVLDVSLGVLFAESQMVEAAALRMRRVPILDKAQLALWKGNDSFDQEPEQEFLHLSLRQCSHNAFALRVEDSANAPEIRKGDEAIFDAGSKPTAMAWCVAQHENGGVAIGRLRILSAGRDRHHFEIMPLDIGFGIASSLASPGLLLRGVLVQTRRKFPI